MNSINQNPDLSEFSNSLKKEFHPIQLNLNDYNENSQTNRSISFTYFNQQSVRNPLLLERNQILNPIKLQENAQVNSQMGFGHLDIFFENSQKFTLQQFKNANIKKAPTFQFSQGYLNFNNESKEIIKQENDLGQNIHQKKCIRSRNKQILRNSGIYNQDNMIKTQVQEELKIQYESISNPIKQKQALETNNKGGQSQSSGENSLQNLKAIAKLAFQGIKRQKFATYQSISHLMLREMTRQSSQTQTNSYGNHQHPSSAKTSERKNKIIQNMIKNKSFGQIKEIAQIQQEEQISYDSGSKKQTVKLQQNQYHFNDSEPFNQNNPQLKNLKNIRRRLYDAINVMLAANIIEKHEKGHLSLRNGSKLAKKVASTSKVKQEQGSYEQLEAQIYQKRKNIQAKRRYKQLLATKYLVLQKHFKKNKLQMQRGSQSHKKEMKLQFPLIFTSVESPLRISLSEMGKSVQIQAKHNLDINCDIDILGLLYWVEKQEIIKKVAQMDQKQRQTSRKRLSSAKDQNDDQEQQKNLGKKIKIETNH